MYFHDLLNYSFPLTTAHDAQPGDTLYAKGQRITNAGLVLTVDRVTPKQVHCTVTGLYFPKHQKPSGSYQIGRDRQQFLREQMLGGRRNFWKTGTEIAGGHQLVQIVTNDTFAYWRNMADRAYTVRKPRHAVLLSTPMGDAKKFYAAQVKFQAADRLLRTVRGKLTAFCTRDKVEI